MIVISTQLLTLVGITDINPGQIAPMVWVSALYSFGGRGQAPLITALEAEIATDPDPRNTCIALIGMADRYGEATRRGATVVELCTDGQESVTLPDAQGCLNVAGWLRRAAERTADQAQSERLVRIADAIIPVGGWPETPPAYAPAGSGFSLGHHED